MLDKLIYKFFEKDDAVSFVETRIIKISEWCWNTRVKIIKKEKEKKMILDEELVIISKIKKHLKDKYQSIGDTMISGGVDNMEKYKYMMGQAHAYQKIDQEISNLLKPKEQKNEEEKDQKTSSTSEPKRLNLHY